MLFFFSFVRFFVSVLHTRYTKMVTTNSSWDGATNQRARRRGSRIIEMTRSSTIISRLRLEIWWLFFFFNKFPQVGRTLKADYSFFFFFFKGGFKRYKF